MIKNKVWKYVMLNNFQKGDKILTLTKIIKKKYNVTFHAILNRRRYKKMDCVQYDGL